MQKASSDKGGWTFETPTKETEQGVVIQARAVSPRVCAVYACDVGISDISAYGVMAGSVRGVGAWQAGGEAKGTEINCTHTGNRLHRGSAGSQWRQLGRGTSILIVDDDDDGHVDRIRASGPRRVMGGMHAATADGI